MRNDNSSTFTVFMLFIITQIHIYVMYLSLKCVFVHYLHKFSGIDEVVLQHLLSKTTHGAVKLISCLTVLNPPGQIHRKTGSS